MRLSQGVLNELVCYVMLAVAIFAGLSLSLGSRAMIDLALR